MLVFFAGYLWNHSSDLKPTGFIQYDNVSYVAYGKQYLDADAFHIQYSNPFNEREYTPIYFQPQSLLFALLLYTGIPPEWILIPFTFICSIICFWLIISIYIFLFPRAPFRTLHLWMFAWGGGLLTLAGTIVHLYINPGGSFFDGIFVLDPEHGWWGLNLGRSLFFTCEAYYHALFLGCIYSLLRRKWIEGIILIFLLSLSHPFTGIELIAIIFVWCGIELFYNRRGIPTWFILFVLIALCFHIYFYLAYLPQFPDHLSVSEQYALNWRLRFYRMIPAYCLVGALAITAVYWAGWKPFLRLRANRLFACWFIVAFILANHEVFTTPRQPIHFTRGYIWTSLFLMGLPALHVVTKYIRDRFGIRGIILLCLVFFSDNFLWIINSVYSKATTPSAMYTSREQNEVLQILKNESTNRTLIVSSDPTIAYLATVKTPAWPWYAHPYTTPFAQRKKTAQELFLKQGQPDTSWMDRPVNFVLYTTDSVALNTLSRYPPEKTIRTGNYLVYKYSFLKN